MTGKSFQKNIYIILIVSALFRFGFLFFGDVLPVMWDARRYVGASIGLISYLDNNDVKPVTSKRQDHLNFKQYTDKYIQGEQIEWLKYQPFTLTEARNEIFIGGPLYPAVMGAIMFLSPTDDFTVIRILNILIDILANLLLILIAMRFISKKGALLTGYIYALYFPFALLTTMLLLESSTTCLMLLTVYCFLLGYEDDNRKFYILAGLFTGLLVLNKPTAMFLSAPFLISFFWYAKQKLQNNVIVNRLLYFIVPFIIISGSWTAIASMKYDQLTFRDPSYKEANLRQSSNILYEGYDLDRVEKGFWEYSISEHILSDPIGYTGLLAKKFERLWSQPANEFNKSYLLPSNWWHTIHLLLVTIGLFGLIMLLIKSSHIGIWILMISGYYTAIHLIFHSVSRYSFNALPFLFIAAAYFITEMVQISTNPLIRKKVYLVLTMMLFLFFWRDNILNIILKIEPGEAIISIQRTVMIISAGILLYFLSRLYFKNKSSTIKLILPMFSILFFTIFTYANTFSREQWSEFTCQISDANMKAGTRIYISNLKTVKPDELIAVVVDVNSGKGRKNTFSISVGSEVYEYIGGEPPLSDLFYPKPTYQYYSQFVPIGIEEFRQYAIIPTTYELLDENIKKYGYIEISTTINDRFKEENNHINLFGNYSSNADSSYIPGIRFTSIERYVHKNDPRIRIPVKYYSDKTISYYIRKDSEDISTSTDLSPAGGIQSGRYNIFIVHFFRNGEFRVY